MEYGEGVCVRFGSFGVVLLWMRWLSSAAGQTTGEPALRRRGAGMRRHVIGSQQLGLDPGTQARARAVNELLGYCLSTNLCIPWYSQHSHLYLFLHCVFIVSLL